MCGIAGILTTRPGSDGELARIAISMAEALRHRGPDDGDVWADSAAGIALAQRRLAIIDLSPAGHQPMHSSCGRFVISYNGEAYNTAELRDELVAAGRPFRGQSDTEVVVEGCAVWGIQGLLQRLNGMFALALWDRAERRLTLARDRLGIKPLYYAQIGGLLLFGSELWSLRAHPGWTPVIDRNAIAAYLRHNYIPAPLTIFQGVQKLEPGTSVTVSAGGKVEKTVFWALADVVRAGKADPLDLSDAEATDALERLLTDAVRRQMVSDVPLGAFLSGGIDSSTVVALMQATSARPVRSFSIGFDESRYNEANYAAAVAKHLGTDHTELYVTSAEARDVIPKLPAIYDEPFSDSSQIPTYLLSALTRRQVTVALSGDGGDELFAGYSRYFLAERMRRTVFRVPRALRQLGSELIRSVPPGAWDKGFALLPQRWHSSATGDRLHKLAGVLSEDPEGFYRRLVSHWLDPASLVAGSHEPEGLIGNPAIRALVPDYTERMQYTDTLTYLPDDILTKVDRASMAVALEVRVPLLDHRVVEFAWRLPKSVKLRGGTGKFLLRKVLYRHVPAPLIDRPKMGFGVPIDAWLRGPLKEWAEHLLSDASLQRIGMFHPAQIRAAWQEHLSGRRNWQYPLWDVLMAQAWLERFSAS